MAYQHGLIGILMYLGNAATFLLGYWVFAARWRRARISTVMEYLVERFDERTRQAFSWTTIVFQFFIGASQLYGLALFVAPACGFALGPTILGSGAVKSARDRKSTRLNSSHTVISYAVFCLQKKIDISIIRH